MSFGNAFYYHGIMRKYVIMFGNYFNGITIQRNDAAGTRVQTIPVPIAYGPKETWLARLTQDPALDRQVAVSLPRMGFEIIGINPGSVRQLVPTKQHYQTSSSADDD